MERPAHLIEKFVVSADGTKVFAGALGNPEKPALVFIHGITLSDSVYNNLFSMPDLSNDFYLVSITPSLHLSATNWSIASGHRFVLICVVMVERESQTA